MFVCLFVCSVVVMFLGFRPHSYDSVGSCLGSNIKEGVVLVEHLYLPGVQPLFRLKTKQHNLNSRADMCFNCSLSVKSMKFGMMIVFKALKEIGYGAIAKKSVKR